MSRLLSRLTRAVVEPAPQSDAHLLAAFLAERSEAAFARLVERHGSMVFGVCMRVLRHRQDAEDAFQAVFVVLARRAGDVWPRETVGSWLYGVAIRVALKARSLRARRASREQHLVEVAEIRSSSPEPDTAEVIDRVVRKLPEVYRAAVIACDLEGLSRKEAAGQLGWSEGTLSGRLARARKILADRLRKVGLAVPSGGLAAVLGTDAPVRAGLEEGVMAFGCPGAASVSAPVAALTEGVAGMIAPNYKCVVAAVVVVCTVGLGAWAGAGDDSGSQPVQATTPTAQPTPGRPRASYALWSPRRGNSRVRKASQCQPARVSFRRS
jgi:RNA polymerase sigma factor (sigma-70 family)